MEHNYQHIYSLIPTLLHLHNPMLPVYLDDNVLHSICVFMPDKKRIFWCYEILHIINNMTNISIHE